MKTLKWMTIVAAAILVQGSSLIAVDAFGVRDAKPALLVVVVIFFGLRGGERYGALFGFAVGLLQDSFSAGYLGTYAMSMTIAGFLAGKLGRQFFWRNLITQVVLVFVLCALACSVTALLSVSLGSLSIGESARIAEIVLVSALYSALAAPLIFFGAGKFVGGNAR